MNENCILSFSIIVDEQNGFRKDRSCLVYTIKQKRQPTFGIFHELKESIFDCVALYLLKYKLFGFCRVIELWTLSCIAKFCGLMLHYCQFPIVKPNT